MPTSLLLFYPHSGRPFRAAQPRAARMGQHTSICQLLDLCQAKLSRSPPWERGSRARRDPPGFPSRSAMLSCRPSFQPARNLKRARAGRCAQRRARKERRARSAVAKKPGGIAARVTARRSRLVSTARPITQERRDESRRSRQGVPAPRRAGKFVLFLWRSLSAGESLLSPLSERQQGGLTCGAGRQSAAADRQPPFANGLGAAPKR